MKKGDSITKEERELRERQQKEFQAYNLEYTEYIGQLKSEWLSKNRRRSNGFGGSDLYETMSEQEREKVHNTMDQWPKYITPFAEAWWKERGYGVIWPENNSETMKLYLLDSVENQCEERAESAEIQLTLQFDLP
jgi:hypothetical protein